MRKNHTQLEMVADHLQEWGAISSWEAFCYYGITRLAAYIWELRHKHGWNIRSKDCTKKNRYGNWCTYTEYVLMEGKDER